MKKVHNEGYDDGYNGECANCPMKKQCSGTDEECEKYNEQRLSGANIEEETEEEWEREKEND